MCSTPAARRSNALSCYAARTRRPENTIDTANLIEQFHTVIRGVVTDFEVKHGYPPGHNEVVLADGDHELEILRHQLADRIPGPIATFFKAITQLSLEDLWNGYFIGPPTWSASLHESAEPRFIRTGDITQEVLIIASNGGGVLYAAPLPSGKPILVLPNGGIEGGIYDTDQTSYFGAVAADLDEFLHRLINTALQDGAHDPFDPFNRK